MSPKYVHPKNRTCQRSDEVLENYRKRALKAEKEVLRLQSEIMRGAADGPVASVGYVWCDWHGEIHEARNVYNDDARDVLDRPACAEYNWRKVYVESDDKNEEF